VTDFASETLFDAAAALEAYGVEQGSSDFGGTSWEQRSPWNIPGPVYVGDDDACGTGPDAAPNNVWLPMDDYYWRQPTTGEFVFRQPSSPYEVRQIILAARTNTTRCYAMDGDEHWTPDLVARWWSQMGKIITSVRSRLDEWPAEAVTFGRTRSVGESRDLRRLQMPSAQVRRWVDYMETDAEAYVVRYVAALHS
jgi:hypothetical protein